MKAIDVANLFLAWAQENGDVVTNLKLQKLLYYAQAWYLVNYPRKILFADPIEAWELGPVVVDVYHRFKKYSSSPIPYKPTGREKTVFQPRQISYLKEMYRVFSNFSATALVSMIHNEKPWREAHAQGKNTVIPIDKMRKYYTKVYAKAQSKKK